MIFYLNCTKLVVQFEHIERLNCFHFQNLVYSNKQSKQYKIKKPIIIKIYQYQLSLKQ